MHSFIKFITRLTSGEEKDNRVLSCLTSNYYSLTSLTSFRFSFSPSDGYGGVGLTGDVQLSRGNHKLSGFGPVGPADVHTGVVTPRVSDDQVCCKDDEIGGDGLSI